MPHVDHEVEQASPFVPDNFRDFDVVQLMNPVDETVGRLKPDGQFERFTRNAAFVFQRASRRVRSAGAQGQRVTAVSQGFRLFHRHPALGVHFRLSGHRSIENARGVERHLEIHPHRGDQPLDLAHVTGLDPTRYDVQPVVLRFQGGLGQVVHDPCGHVGESGDMGTGIAGGIGVDDGFPFGDRSHIPGLADDLRNVVPNRFGKAGGVDRDHLGIVDVENVGNGLEQISLPPEDGRPFREGTRRGQNRFFVMAGQGTAVVGATALRTVAVRHTLVYPQRGVQSADRLTGLGGIECQRLAFQNFA